ncbi:ABC transporter permease [Chlamydiales bacterium]|nr:ABC transporter permease [Chlamydiales bacterium]
MKRNILLLILLFASILLIWELGVTEKMRWIFPPPTDVFSRMWEMRSSLLEHTWITFQEMIVGLFFAFFLAIPIAFGMWRFKRLNTLLQPLFIIIQCIPMITLAPIMILWFGFSFISIVIPTFLMIFFPLTITFYKGLSSTPQSLLDLFTVHQANGFQCFFKLQLPWSIPYLLSGFRISCSIAFLAAVASEWVGGQKGLGVLMLEARRSYDLKTAFAALFTMVFLSLLLYLFTLILELTFGKRYNHKVIHA